MKVKYFVYPSLGMDPVWEGVERARAVDVALEHARKFGGSYQVLEEMNGHVIGLERIVSRGPDELPTMDLVVKE